MKIAVIPFFFFFKILRLRKIRKPFFHLALMSTLFTLPLLPPLFSRPRARFLRDGDDRSAREREACNFPVRSLVKFHSIRNFVT